MNVLAFRFNLTRYTRNSWTYGWITTGSLKDMIEQFVQALYGGMDQRELVIANSKHLLYNLHVAADKLLYRMPKEEALRALHKAKKAASRMTVNLNEKHNEDKEIGSTS